MFVQVIQGRVSDAERLRAAVERWAQEVAPGAIGWLGSTGGVTEDGRFIVLARFESEEAARRNSERPEQDQWWTETAKLFTGEPTFRESTDVTVDVTGDPDQAGFVQVMQGRGSDPERAREIMSQDAEKWAAFRPDVIGSVSVGLVVHRGPGVRAVDPVSRGARPRLNVYQGAPGPRPEYPVLHQAMAIAPVHAHLKPPHSIASVALPQLAYERRTPRRRVRVQPARRSDVDVGVVA
jgi:hypothetical protein